ncbi:putative mediator of RNA polymerase II transcription subunit 29 [Centruroides vittatus]|uniref:putative mediator of RNA polymerase II transcription subunit 29 n=1 Tax=Centruroides vittatus TaxID=120091 RepID=UPI00350F142F
MIMKLTLRCPNMEKGCHHKCSLEAYDNHLANCEYETVQCRNENCQENCIRKLRKEVINKTKIIEEMKNKVEDYKRKLNEVRTELKQFRNETNWLNNGTAELESVFNMDDTYATYDRYDDTYDTLSSNHSSFISFQETVDLADVLENTTDTAEENRDYELSRNEDNLMSVFTENFHCSGVNEQFENTRNTDNRNNNNNLRQENKNDENFASVNNQSNPLIRSQNIYINESFHTEINIRISKLEKENTGELIDTMFDFENHSNDLCLEEENLEKEIGNENIEDMSSLCSSILNRIFPTPSSSDLSNENININMSVI